MIARPIGYDDANTSPSGYVRQSASPTIPDDTDTLFVDWGGTSTADGISKWWPFLEPYEETEEEFESRMLRRYPDVPGRRKGVREPKSKARRTFARSKEQHCHTGKWTRRSVFRRT